VKKENVCPGCSKHCPLNAPRCKYGIRHAAKLQKKATACATKKQKQYKWERHTAKGGPAHLMLTVSRSAKKALCHEKTTEERMFASFTPAEKELFASLLAKIDTGRNEG